MRLTSSEFEMMGIFWRENRPMTRGEILADTVDREWKDSSIHILLNSLLRKGAIREAGYAKCGKRIGRTYEAAIGGEEYVLGTLASIQVEPDYRALTEAYRKIKNI